MRFIRYQIPSRTARYGWIWEDLVGPIEGSPFGEYRRLEADIKLENVQILPPVLPGKIICIAVNYSAYAREQGIDAPEVPVLYLKPPSTVIGAYDSIILPPQSSLVEHGATLAVVIGRMARWITPEEALDYVLGYTVANDITARDMMLKDQQWTRAKGFDTFCPLGPWIETQLDANDLLITCRVNDEMRQMDSTHEMLFTIPQMIAFVSSIMTLYPGDVLLTGTPGGVGPLVPGDVLETIIEGIGEIRNPVVEFQRNP